jgi:hypothetical protein
MKKNVFVRVALVACMAVLSLTTTALAQEESSEAAAQQAAASEKAAVAATGQTASSGAEYVSDYSTYVANCVVGPRTGDTLVRCYNVGFTASNPRNVQCQARNPRTEFINYPDQFACQVIGTSSANGGTVWFRVRRLDVPGWGWGQNLNINLHVVQ